MREIRLYLDDMLESISRIRDFVLGMTFDEFVADLKTQDAVLRNLEIIGEAAGKLPEEIVKDTTQIEWRKIKGLRNLLAHEYFGVDVVIIWDIVENKLAALELACQKLLSSSYGQDSAES
ncbi:MAG: DUF86 domain-containing protein [Bacteroidia bacterium]|nr:DUF86 domain-containing protein [Bacteroidia bacterium]